MKTFLVLFFFFIVLDADFSQAAERLNCELEQSESHWNGSCGKYKGKRLLLNVSASESIKTGVWRSGVKAFEIWSGELKYGKAPVQSIEIERYKNNVSIARTPFGWFELSDWSQSKNEIKFVMRTDMEVPTSGLDLKIIQRANEILKSENSWNRTDNRKCPEDATTWSIYCSMNQAITEISGSFHNRRPAMQIVRRIVKNRSQGRSYKQALMEYNNDQSTSFEDVLSLFKEAQNEIARLTN